MRADHNFTLLGALAKEVGWGYTEIVEELETQRKIKEQAFYTEKKAKISLKGKTLAAANLSAVKPILSALGY